MTSERVRLEKQTRFNPLADWTPDVLTRQLSAWARGDIRELAYVMEWLEDHDDTICTVAPKAKAAVSRHGYDIMLEPEIAPALKGMAEDQRGVLQEFYASIHATHAIDQDLQGGFRLLVNQVMDGYGKRWATHYLVWNRGRAKLSLETTMVPLWFWEATEGKLRFLEHHAATRGVDRENYGGPSAWMVSRGRGVMLACSIARMFKQIPLQDWLTYCDRHGMPAFLGKSTAAPDSMPWQQLFDAVTNIGAEYGAVVSAGDSIDVLNLTSQGEIPYEKIVDRMERAMVMLWRGGDLSTISRSNAVGSNPQQEDSDDLDADNAEWASETIDRQLSRRVIDYHFGVGAPQLAKLKLRVKTRDNVKQDLEVVKAFREMGERVSKPWAVGKFNVVLADDDEPALGESAAPAARPTPAPTAEATALNTSTRDFNTLLETTLAEALGVQARVLAPIRPIIDRLATAAQSDRMSDRMSDANFLQAVEDAAHSLPELFDAANPEAMAKLLEGAMGTAALQGVRDGMRARKQQPTDQ